VTTIGGRVDDLVGVGLVPVVLAGDGFDFVFGEPSDFVTDLALFVGEPKLHN